MAKDTYTPPKSSNATKITLRRKAPFPGVPSSQAELHAALESGVTERQLLRRVFELSVPLQADETNNERSRLVPKLKFKAAAQEPIQKLIEELQQERVAQRFAPQVQEKEGGKETDTTCPPGEVRAATAALLSLPFFDPTDLMYYWNEFISAIRLREYNRLVRSHPHAYRIFAEGDSQFQLLPDFRYSNPGDVVQEILHRNIPIRSIARAGANAIDLAAPGRLQEVTWILQNSDPFDIAIISAGGNDLLGAQFSSLLIQQPSPDLHATGPLSQFIDINGLLTFLDGPLRDRLKAMLQNIRAADPGLPILLHCYYLLFPGAGFLHQITSKVQTTLEDKNIVNEAVQKDIIDFVVHRANETYQTLTQPDSPHYISNCHFLDNRDRLVEADFHVDEIHPVGQGFRRIASAFLDRAGIPYA